MYLLVSVAVLAVIVGYLLGGRLRGFERLRLWWWPLGILGLAMQLAPIPDLPGDLAGFLSVGLLIGSYVLLLAFAARNILIAGFPLILLGLAMNFTVITANGGMPVSRQALIESGQTDAVETLEKGEATKHHLKGPDDLLVFLADVIAVGRPIRQVVSVGDLVIYAGVSSVVVTVMRGWNGRRAARLRQAGAPRAETPGPEVPLVPPARSWGTEP